MWTDRFAHWLHARLLLLLVSTYIAAALVPGLGLAVRGVNFGNLAGAMPLNLPTFMLAFLLFNAGLGVRTAALKHWHKSALTLGAGSLANIVVPAAFVALASQALAFWHNPDETQNILTGLALVASMPIAGSSTAWSQNADGDLAVSLGLVLVSTGLSPLTTPAVLHAAALTTTGVYAHNLRQLAGQSTSLFLLIFVLVPSLIGILVRQVLGEERTRRIQPTLKVANTFVLLLLCYSNAAVTLPQTVAKPDPDFLALVLIVATLLCVTAFISGWGLARLLRLSKPREASLVFGLGMNNNGTGLVVATAAMSAHPLVLLPILFYNLVQHLVAGVMGFLLFRNSPGRIDRLPEKMAA
jgi:bile acid:Na+ symporter, BASS family